MRSITLFAIIAALLTVVLSPSVALATGVALKPEEHAFGTRTKAKIVPGHYIVAFKDSVDHPEKLARAQVKQREGKLGVVFSSALKGYAAKLSKGAVKALRKDPRIRYIVPDYELQAQAQTIPTGIERILATKNPIADIDGLDDQRVNANVAVIDTGVDDTHPDLNVVSSVDCTTETNGGLRYPTGVTADSKGNVWVADTEQHRVEEFNAKGEYVAQIGTYGNEPGKFIDPGDIVIDSKGNVWVADTSSGRVEEFEPNGKFLQSFGTAEYFLTNGPRGIAVDAAGSIWVTTSSKYPLQKFSPEGKLLKTFSSGSKSGEFSNPTGITVDAKGNIWVADSSNNRIQELDPEGKFLFEFGKYGSGNGQLSSPRDVAIDAAGNAWVADRENQRVQKFNAKGEYLTLFGEKGSGPGQFGSDPSFGGGPTGLAIGSEGSIFVSDPVNDRVEKWSSASTPAFLQDFGWPGCIDSPSAGTFEPHATHVAGTIGAIDNGEGVVGVAPGARIWSVRVLNRNGSGLLSWIAAGIDWVTATREDEDPNNDIEVANMSLGGFMPKTAAKPIDDAISGYEEGGKHIPGAVDEGVAVVVAAGNEGGAITEGEYEAMPAANRDAITVGALTDTDGKAGGVGPDECYDEGTVLRPWADDVLAPFSNWGPEVDIVAPGVCILSTWPEGHYETISGTSMATPHVAGAAALLASQSKPNTKKDVEAIRNQLVEGGSLNYKYPKPSPAPLLYAGGTPLSEPEAITGGVSGVTGLKATLQGAVQPRTKKVEYKFEIGTTTKYGTSWPASLKTINAGTGFTRVSQEVTNLQPDTIYHYRLYATSGGKVIEGKDGEFTTPMFVRTAAAAQVEESSATLEGRVLFSALGLPTNPKTTYEFEYGTTDKYGSKVGAEISGTNVVIAHAYVGKLQKTTVYHYRLVAKNEYGTFNGRDQRFRTAGWVAQELGKAFKETTGPDHISCPTATRCIGVEWGDEHAYEWNGESWSTQPVPAKSESNGVACASASDCMAVGSRNLNGELFAMWWDGDSWTDTSPSLPSEAKSGFLQAVSCPAVDDCFAAGQYWTGNEGSDRPKYLLLRWDGESWSTLTAPEFKPQPAEYWTYLTEDMSCPSASECVTVGWASLRWNGVKWSQVETPAELDHDGRAVSCGGVGDCVATNGYETPVGAVTDAAMHWNGEEWTSMPPLGELTPLGATTAFLSSISCPEADSCSAVGWAHRPAFGFPDAREPIAVRWDGSQWSDEYVDTFHGFPTSGEHRPWGVSCVSSGRCLAVGISYVPAYGRYPLVMTYNYSSPTAVTDAATVGSTGSVQLHATVNPNAYDTHYQFEYGETSKFGTKVPLLPEGIGGGRQSVQVSQTVAAPEPGASMHFRVVATNEQGTSYGDELATPSVDTGQAIEVGPIQATLKGSVNPQRLSTSYQFEYADTAAYDPKSEDPYSGGGSVPVEPAQIGGGDEDAEVSQAVKGLRPEMTYHYRLVAISKGGTTYGVDETFTTPPPIYSFSFASYGAGNGQLISPPDLAVDPSGNVWVADDYNDRVQEFGPSGSLIRVVGSKGEGNGQFHHPFGIAAAPNGNVWVADTENNRIQEFDKEGKFIRTCGKAGSGTGQLSIPEGLAVDPKGNVWVADRGNLRVEKFSETCSYLSSISQAKEESGPFDVALDLSGNVWVAYGWDEKVAEFSPAGALITKWGEKGSASGQLSDPYRLEIGPDGNVWVAEYGNNRVQVFTPTGKYLYGFGSAGSGPGQIKYARGIGFSPSGDAAYVLDAGAYDGTETNARVEKWAR